MSSDALYFDFLLECIPFLLSLCLAFMFACHCLLGCSVVLCVVAPEWLVVRWLPFVLLFLQFMRRACLLAYLILACFSFLVMLRFSAWLPCRGGIRTDR